MRHLLKTMRIFAWSWYLQKLISVGAILRFIFNFFVNQNFSRHRKTELLRKWIALVLQAKFRFMGCLVKANPLVIGNIALSLSSQLIVLVFTKQPSAERYLANIFLPVLLSTSSASKYVLECLIRASKYVFKIGVRPDTYFEEHLPTTVFALHSHHSLLLIRFSLYSAPSSSLSLLLLIISPIFVFGSNLKGFKEFKSGISFSLKSLSLLLFSFSMFFQSFSVLFHFFLPLLVKNHVNKWKAIYILFKWCWDVSFGRKKTFIFVNRVIESHSRSIKAKWRKI